jgi:hypothetical protein
MSALERRLRMLLRAYPHWYLADRGEEMLGTLLDASSQNQAWPTARDTSPLVTAGLRVRSGLGQRESMTVGVRRAMMLAIMLLVSQAILAGGLIQVVTR